MIRYTSLVATAFLFAATTDVFAHDFKAGDLTINHPWARATPAGARVGGGYMTITNAGQTPDRLVSGTFENSERVEIHEMAMDGSVMKMRHLPQGLEIKPGQSVEFKPGSYHLMFMKLKMQLKLGDKIKGSLQFEKAGKVEVTYKVEAAGSKANEHTGHGKH